MRTRLGIVFAVSLLPLAWRVPEVQAAAEVHRFNLVFSAVPGHVQAGDFNSLIDDINRTALTPRGLEPLSKIRLAWLFDCEMRYFVRQNLAVSAGVGTMQTKTSQEYLPAIGQSVVIGAEVSSVPLHVGTAYYFSPYTQGDFQARAYVGGGFMSVIRNRATTRLDVTGVAGVQPFKTTGTNDAPGYYGEVGAHLFFASRLSVLLSGFYRSNVVRNLVDSATGQPILREQGQPVSLDVGGAGFRMAVGVGL